MRYEGGGGVGGMKIDLFVDEGFSPRPEDENGYLRPPSELSTFFPLHVEMKTQFSLESVRSSGLKPSAVLHQMSPRGKTKTK
jgi:hypothetical protein